LGIFDARLRLVTRDGRPAPLTSITVEDAEYRLTNGEAVIYNMTVGSYRARAAYLNIPVLDGEIEIHGEDGEIPVIIYRLNVRAYTVDDSHSIVEFSR